MQDISFRSYYHHVSKQPFRLQFPLVYRILSPKYSTLHWSFLNLALLISAVRHPDCSFTWTIVSLTAYKNDMWKWAKSLMNTSHLFLLAVPTGDAVLFNKTLFQHDLFLMNPCSLCLNTATSQHWKVLSTLLGYRDSVCWSPIPFFHYFLFPSF